MFVYVFFCFSSESIKYNTKTGKSLTYPSSYERRLAVSGNALDRTVTRAGPLSMNIFARVHCLTKKNHIAVFPLNLLNDAFESLHIDDVY